jgi:hypothetical protein
MPEPTIAADPRRMASMVERAEAGDDHARDALVASPSEAKPHPAGHARRSEGSTAARGDRVRTKHERASSPSG